MKAAVFQTIVALLLAGATHETTGGQPGNGWNFRRALEVFAAGPGQESPAGTGQTGQNCRGIAPNGAEWGGPGGSPNQAAGGYVLASMRTPHHFFFFQKKNSPENFSGKIFPSPASLDASRREVLAFPRLALANSATEGIPGPIANQRGDRGTVEKKIFDRTRLFFARRARIEPCGVFRQAGTDRYGSGENFQIFGTAGDEKPSLPVSSFQKRTAQHPARPGFFGEFPPACAGVARFAMCGSHPP